LKRVKIQLARHLPWWAVLLLGVASVVFGAVLTSDPPFSLSASIGWSPLLRRHPYRNRTRRGTAPDVLKWIGDRFVGKPAPTTCS
jgi:hypothetical protein